MDIKTGTLTFRAANERLAALPVEYINNAADTITQRHFANREAYSQIRQNTLNLPDSGNAENKKIIDQINQEVESDFDAFTNGSDVWSKAADTIYKERDKLMADDRIKRLGSWNAAYQAGLKAISDSGMNARDQQLANQINAKQNQDGIGTGDKVNTYKTWVPPGDLNFSKYFEKATELAKGFEADQREYNLNPRTFDVQSATPAFKAAMTMMGTERIKSVSSSEVQKFIRDYLASDSNFQAEAVAKSELELFAKSGGERTKANSQDMYDLHKQAADNGDMRAIVQAIGASTTYRNNTEKMTPEQKDAYLNKILKSPSQRTSLVQEGLVSIHDTYANMNPSDLDQNYKQWYINNQTDNIMGVASKYDYVEQSLNNVDFIDLYSTKAYEKYMEESNASALIKDFGSIDDETVKAAIEKRPGLAAQVSAMELSIKALTDNPNRTSADNAKLEQLQSQLNNTRSLLSTQDFFIETAKRIAGIDDAVIEQQAKPEVLEYLTAYQDLNISKSEREEFYNILNSGDQQVVKAFIKDKMKISANGKSFTIPSTTHAGTPIRIENLDAVTDQMTTNIIDYYTRRKESSVSKVTQRMINDKGLSEYALPIKSLGLVNGEGLEATKFLNSVLESITLGDGNYTYVDSTDKDLISKTNLGQSARYRFAPESGKEKGTSKLRDMQIEIVLMGDASLLDQKTGNNLGGSVPYYRVTGFNEDGELVSDLYQDNSSNGAQAGMITEITDNLRARLQRQDNPQWGMDYNNYKMLVGFQESMKPVKQVNGEDKQMSLATALSQPMVTGDIRNISFEQYYTDGNLYNANAEITKLKDGTYEAKLTIGGSPIKYSLAKPTDLLEKLGSIREIGKAKTKEDLKFITDIFKR